MDSRTEHQEGSTPFNTSVVKRLALEQGFDAVGIAQATPLHEPVARYRSWLKNNYHGMMQYMERNVEVREDVERMLEGVQSVIVVAKNYYTPHQHSLEAEGKISRYAWGDDYHDIMRPMLNELCTRLTEHFPNSASRGAVDSAPVMEKEWAVRAGLGWQGKHSNVIRRDIGSWFFLGVVFTTIPLQADQPIPDYCGSCTACIEACPTQAIVNPLVVDGSKCLSYWTIEVKPEHELPAEIVNGLDNWLFGCDVCQDVCPWNRFQQPTNDERFAPRNNETSIEPSRILSLQPMDFAERFRHSPLKRPKLAGLQRTAAALLKNKNKKKNL